MAQISVISLIWIGKTEGLEITSQLYSDDGNLLATMKDNEYRAISGDSLYIEKDGNLSTLIVMGRTTWFRLWTTDSELLYIKFLNASTVQIRGQFSCPGYQSLIISDTRLFVPPIVSMAGGCSGGYHTGIQVAYPKQ